MLSHGAPEVAALAARCVVTSLDDENGWSVDLWRMDDDDADLAIAAYEALLLGGRSDPVEDLLKAKGYDLSALLLDSEHSKDDITRADLAELTAAASIVATQEHGTDELHMPNVPKMARKKSDSGIDIFAVWLDPTATDEELLEDERLTVASVKHSITKKSTAGIRGKLDASVNADLTVPYLTHQLRVLNGRLQQEGYSEPSAARVYLFLDWLDESDTVDVFVVGVVAPDMEDDFKHHVELLTDAVTSNKSFRIVLMPGLRKIHERCP